MGLLLLILFILVGIPALAKLIPWLFEPSPSRYKYTEGWPKPERKPPPK